MRVVRFPRNLRTAEAAMEAVVEAAAEAVVVIGRKTRFCTRVRVATRVERREAPMVVAAVEVVAVVAVVGVAPVQ